MKCYFYGMLIPTSVFVLLCTVGASILGLLLAGLIGATIDQGLHSSDVASWVQAIGATLGLAIAVWLPFKQKQDADLSALALSRDSTRRMQLAFHDELKYVFNNILPTKVSSLLCVEGRYFDLEIPIPSQRFPIYSSLVGRLPELDEDELRKSIITAYATLNSLLDMAKMHNRQLLDCIEIKRQVQLDESERLKEELERIEKQLSETTRIMQWFCRAGINRADQTVGLLEVSLGLPASNRVNI